MRRVLGPLLATAFAGALLTLGVGQEIPVGSLSGRVTMRENGQPLPGALVTLSLKGAPDDERPRVKGVETDENGEYAFRDVPAGDYTVEVSAKEHRTKATRVDVAEGKARTARFVAEPDDPYLNLYASQRVFTPGETPKVELHGFVPQRSVRLQLYRLDTDRVAREGGLQAAVQPLARPDDAKALEGTGERIQDVEEAVGDRDAEGAFVETLPVGTLKEGVYFVRCSAGEEKASAVLLVSKLALVAKTGMDGKTLCFVTDLAAGKPMAGVAILGAGSRPMARTDADGLATVASPGGHRQAVLMARQGESVALVDFDPGRDANAKVWIDAYCERPAYRPGDPVRFKGFVRRVDGEGYRLPGGGDVAVTVKDPDGNPIQTLSLPLSPHGSFDGSFTTSPEGKPGGYAIECAAFGGKSADVGANVVAYRKPEFSIEVTPDRDHYAMGNAASATVECRYYYGGPVVGAKVKATIYRSPVFTYDDDEGNAMDGDSYDGGEYSQAVEAVTDASGRARIAFDTHGENDPAILTNDYDYTVSAAVTEDGGKLFDGEGKVRVTRGDLGMSMRVENPILVPGDTARILIRTTAPTDPKKPVAGRMVTVEAGVEAYSESAKASTFVRRDSFAATTGADGTAVVQVPVRRAESLTFHAKATDDAGRPIVAEAWAYVEGSPAAADARRGELKLTLDHGAYRQGDRAKLLLQTDLPGGTALVTIQTNRVLWRRTVALASGTTILEVPVVKDYAPNVYVSAAYVREKRFLQADRSLRVDREDRRLNVQVQPLKPVYRPGTIARVRIRTSDSSGRPVPAEVSVGTVDRGVYDIAKDPTDLYASLYPNRSDGVRTNYSFPEIYLDGGDKGTSKVPLRKEFRDTAAWTPAVWTGISGEATVDVPLPDNLTEWRVTAIGMSDASQAGMATAAFRASKPLMVRLGLPQFLVEGDHQRLTATIANDTGKDADVSLDVRATGLRLTDAVPKSIHVPAGTPQIVDLELDALGAGTASLAVRALIPGGESDGVERSFPILAHGRPLLETRAGEGDADFSLALAGPTDPKLGALRITVSPTIAGDLGKALDGLIDFPYGCVEQTMSRFMPATLVGRAVRDLGLPAPKRLAELPEITRDSLVRLARMRHADGGWGWWEYDDSEPFMTALVLDGLDRARQTGVDVETVDPEAAVKWGLGYLGDKERSKTATLRDRLYLVDTLLRWGGRDAARFLDGVDLRDHVDKNGERHPTSAELATAVLAFHAAGRDAASLIDRLIGRARVGEETVTWAPEDDAWGGEATALALVALETARPDSPLLPRVVRGLMGERQGDGWASTRDTAYALVGLTAYLSRTRELSGPSTATIVVDGRDRGTFTLDPRAADPARTVEIPRAELRGATRIRIRTRGRVYRTVALSGFEVANPLEARATDRDLRVERKTFLMEPRRDKDGTMRLLPSERPVTEFRNGDVVRVELTIHSAVPREFVLVEEPTPSSCRVAERTELEEGETKDWWWSRTVVMDDHLAFFARDVPRGESKIVYHMRAEAAGRAAALPARAENMYDPGRWASTAETDVTVAR